MAEALKRADVRAFIGATGSGKGIGIRSHIKRDNPSRLMIFDPMHEYTDLAKPFSDLSKMLGAMTGKAWRVAWQPPDGSKPGARATDYESKEFKALFSKFCQAAFMVGDCWMLVEELELVTSPKWAPAQWRNCTKRGRHRGLVVLGATQRPADCDKAFLSSCTFIRCHALREHGDRQRVAQALDVPIEQIEALKTLELSPTKTEVNYYYKDYKTGTSGAVKDVLTR